MKWPGSLAIALLLGSASLCGGSGASSDGDGSVSYLAPDTLVPLLPEQQACVDNPLFFNGTEQVFAAIDSVADGWTNKPLAKNALIGAEYTGFLQIAYLQSAQAVFPFADGTTRECSLGCIKRMSYLGQEFHDVCVTDVCAEGKLSDGYCDSTRGNDIYFDFQTFFCRPMVLVSKACGVGGRCVNAADGPRCRTIPNTRAHCRGGTQGGVNRRPPQLWRRVRGAAPAPCRAQVPRVTRRSGSWREHS